MKGKTGGEDSFCLSLYVYGAGNCNPGSLWISVGFLPDERNWRAWGLVLPFLKGMDRTNCIPVAPVSLLVVWRPDQTQTPTPAVWISTVDPIKTMGVWPWSSQDHTEPCVSMGVSPYHRGPGSYRTACSISLEGLTPLSQGNW